MPGFGDAFCLFTHGSQQRMHPLLFACEEKRVFVY